MRKAFLVICSCFSVSISFGQVITYSGSTTICTGQSILLTVTGAPTLSMFQWLNGGTPIGGATNISYPATTSGSYTVRVDTGTIVITPPVVITVIPPPVPAFTFAPDGVCTRIPIQFTNGSTGATSYSWNFGDGLSGSNNTSVQSSPIHTFVGIPGNGNQQFTVQLLATNAGCTSGPATAIVTTKMRSSTLLNGSGPTTYNGEDYFTRCLNSSGPFTFSNGSITDGTNTHYTITWGDGSPNFDATTFGGTLSHTYNVGTYPILFIVSGPSGCIDTGFYHAFVGAEPLIGLLYPGNATICTGDSLTFHIGGTASNPPGTLYTMSFGDGTAPLNFTHPPPDSVTHVFINTSCGTSVPGYSNSFNAIIVARNPCKTATAFVAPIYVSRKGKSNFSVIPGDTICANKPVQVIDVGEIGYNIAGGVCIPGKLVWKITPSTGWTVDPGYTPGNDYNSDDPAIWIKGDNPLPIKFTTPGSYTIKIRRAGNAACGVDTMMRTICVNPEPSASFNLDGNIGCAPFIVKTTTTTNTPFCGTYRYLWSVTYAPTSGCVPAISNYSFINGTSSASAQPELKFTNPGVYTLGLIVIAPAATCSTALVTKVITVKEKPNVTLSAPSVICENQPINPTVVASCYTSAGTYSWTFTGGSPSSSTSANPGTVIYSTAGTYTIAVDVTNECGTTSKTQQITVGNVTTADAGPPQTLCGGTVIMAGNPPVFGSGLWTKVSGPPANILFQSSPITIITGLTPGTYIFKWTITNGICVSSSNVTIIIVPGGTQPLAGPDQSLCLATTATLSGNIPINGTGMWSLISGPGAVTITNASSPITTVTGLVTGTYTFGWSISFSNCATTTDNVQITISENPSTSYAGPDQTICTSSTTMAATAPLKGTGSWVKVSSGPFATIVSPNSPTTAITGLSTGTYIFRWTVVNGACIPSEDEVQIVVTGTATAAAAGPNQLVCAVSTISLSGNNPSVGTGTWTMTSGPNTPIISNPNLPSTTVTGVVTGTYTFRWTIVNGVCPPTFDDISVMITPPILNTINSSTDTVCGGNLYTTNAPPATGGNNSTPVYIWQTSSNGILFNNIPGATSVNYSANISVNTWLRRIATIGPCTSFSDTIHIIVQATITNNNISNDAAICINTASPQITGIVPSGGNGVFNYQWERSTDNGVTWTQIPGAFGKDYNPGILTVTSKYRRKVSTTTCTGPQAVTSNVVTITVNPDAKASFIPTDTIKCSPYLLSGAVVNAQSFSYNGQYLWYVDSVYHSTGSVYHSTGIPFAGYTMLNANDTIILKLVTTSLFGCRSDSTSHMFITRIKPVPSFTISDTVGCGPVTVQIQNTSVNINQYTYQWIFGNGQTSTAQQPGSAIYPPNPAFGDTVYTLTLKAFSVCDTILFSKTIRVKSKPKALFTPTKTVGCSPMLVTFRNTSKGRNNSYFWDFDDGTTLATNNGDSVQHTFYTGIVDTFYVKLVAVNECGIDSIRYAIIATPNTIVLNFAMNGPDHFGCAPHSVALINNSTGGTSFKWNFGDGNILNSTSNVDTIYHTYLTPGNYSVSLRAQNSCSDTTATDFITVYPKPVAAFIANKYSACKGDTIRFTNQSDSATSFLWKFGDGVTSTLVNPVHIYTLSGTYTVTLKSSRINPSGNVCQDSIIHQVQVVASLPGSFTLSATSAVCVPVTITFINQNRPAATTNWTFGDGGTATGDSVVHTYLTAGVFTVSLTATSAGGCAYISSNTVNIGGPYGSLLYNPGYNCYPAPVRLEAIANNTDTLIWNFGDGNQLRTTQRIVYHNYVNPGNYLPGVSLKSNSGCNYPIAGIDTIKVDRIISGFTSTQQKNCGNTIVTFNDTSHVFFGKAQVKWNFGDNTNGTGISAVHTYAIPGTYPVQMIVIGNSGCSDTLMKQVVVSVNSKPNATILADTAKCTTQVAIFSSSIQSTDPINIRQWTISNGATALGPILQYTFTVSGTYTVTFIAGTINGCYDTTYHSIIIRPSPAVIANADINLCQGNSAQLFVSGALQYQWSPFQGLNCTTCFNPMATPVITTPYVVEGKNSFGCPGYDTVLVKVIPPFNMTVSPNDTICIGLSANLFASGASSYTWSPALGLSSTTISNPTATPLITTSYRVIGSDGYNCFSDTVFVIVAVGQYPKVDLGPDLVLSTGTTHPLQSTIINGPIRTWLWTPSRDLSCSTCPLPTATVKKDITYMVTATNIYGCPATDSITLKVFCESSQVFIPNAFTPDGDGVNDILMVRGTGIVTVKSFRIFNRWGELVFEKSNFAPNIPSFGWDGKIRGVVGEPAVYVYTAEVICENEIIFTYKGNTTILK